LLDKIQQFPHLRDRSKRPQVFGPVINHPPCKKDPWERLFFYDDKGITFIVLQVNIKPGLVLFDERILQEERILLGIYDGKLDAVDPLNQVMGLVIGKGLCEIGAHPFAEVFCLTYVQQNISRIIVFINAWLMGNGMCYALKVTCCHYPKIH
jgi:hypothetical protein